MSTPRRPSGPNRPHASRSEKVRDAKGAISNTGVSGGRGIGEAPNSRLKKIAIWSVLFIIVLFIVMDFIDRANAKKKSHHYEPTADLPISRVV